MTNLMKKFLGVDEADSKYKAVAIANLETVDDDGSPLPKSDAAYVYIECQFNPTELKLTKKVKWSHETHMMLNSPDLDFGGGEPATFSLSLLFDTTDVEGDDGRDVRKFTNQLFRLVMLFGDETTREEPPQIKFEWGEITLFLAVVEEVDVTYTLFDFDGVPVRAKATVKFIQLDGSDDPELAQNPTSRTEARKTRVIQMGDRLDYVAYQEYGHVSHWRYLAEVNNLLDPTDLRPGQILLVPPLP